MRIRRGVIAVLVAAAALTACADADLPAAEPVATDPAATDGPPAPSSPSSTTTTEATEPDGVGEVPNDIPLGTGLWDARGDGGEYHPQPYRPAPDEERVTLDLCGRVVWPLDDPVDQWWAWATGPEYGDRRELVVLPTVEVAVSAVETFRSAIADCGRDGHTVWTEHGADTGHDTVTFTRSYTDGLGLGTYQVTRVGPAVLYTVGYGEGAVRDATRTVLRRTELTRTIAAGLCVYAQAGCGGEESSAPVPAIPADFPLVAGWPSRTGEPGSEGLTGPDRTLPRVELAPCDVPADDPEYVDRLRADWGDIEDHRSRQLTLYPTELGASDALWAIVETYLSCTNDSDGHTRTAYVLEHTSYGDESWSVAETSTYDGDLTTSLVVSHFVRVGAALLVDTDYGEGGAGPPGTVERHVRSSAASAGSVIEAMCAFTTAGC